MTAVQQYWIVENDAMLVSNITPVPVADEQALRIGAATFDSFATDDTPLDGWAGQAGISSITLVTISIHEYINPYDSADRWKGAPAGLSSVVVTTAQQSYSNPYDTADKWKGAPAGLASITVTTVVVTYDNLYDTSDKWKGKPAIASVTIT